MTGKRSERVNGGTKKSNAEVVVANKTSLNIEKLPNEMLQKVFEKLIELENDDDSNISNRKAKLTRKKQSYLNCRLVNSRWKLGMESVLEKKSLSIWQTKSISIPFTDMKAEPPKLGYLFVLKPEDRDTTSEWAYLPSPLESFEEKWNPFPSRSLKLTSDLGDSTRLPGSTKKPRRVTQLIGLVSIFSKFGDNLTSLILTYVTLSPETLIGILGNTPNLKALNLMRVVFRGDLDNCAQLPALQHLQHFRAFQVKIMKKKAGKNLYIVGDGCLHQYQLYDWLLSPYEEQLVTLGVYGEFGIRTETNYANLERLFVYHVIFAGFLQAHVFQYPRLKSLFLMNVQIKFNGDIMGWFQLHIEPLAKTLSDLYLDLPREWVGEYPLFQLSTLTNSQNKIAKVIFQEMKTFAITFPEFPEEVQVIKTLIKGFPNLETLMFLDRNLTFQVAGAHARSVLSGEEYVKVCPKLKTVMIRPLYSVCE